MAVAKVNPAWLYRSLQLFHIPIDIVEHQQPVIRDGLAYDPNVFFIFLLHAEMGHIQSQLVLIGLPLIGMLNL
ncbi:hypothetical protein D3C81_2229840 [compost metagenome]